jgi:hypothetical protein
MAEAKPNARHKAEGAGATISRMTLTGSTEALFLGKKTAKVAAAAR